jgi:PST family polysaccharide transporter
MSDDKHEERPVHARSIFGGVAWSLVAIMSEQASSFLAFIVLARILGPSEFGIVVLTVATIDIMLPLVRSGAAEGIIRFPDLDRVAIGSALWTNMAIGVFLAAATLVAAPLVADWFGQDQIEPQMMVLSVVFPLAALSSIAEALLARRMAFKLVARRTITASIAGTAVAIALAFAGFGPWAMIFQRITIIALGCVLNLWSARLVPPLAFSGEKAKAIARFGSAVATTNMLYRLQPRFIELVIGSFLTPAAVALYRVSIRLLELIAQLPLQPVMRVIFPTLSRLQDKPMQFRNVLTGFMGGTTLLMVPVYAGLGYFASQLFPLMFGHKWDQAVPVFTLLCAAWALRTTITCVGPAASATGASGRVTTLVTIDTVFGIALMVAALPWGIYGIAVSRIVGGLIAAPLYFLMLHKIVHLTLRDVVRCVAPAYLTSAFLLLSIALVDYLSWETMGIRLNVFVGIPLCVLSLVVFGRLFAHQLMRRVLAIPAAGAARKAADRVSGLLRL